MAIFCTMSKQNGICMYIEEYQDDYIELAPLVNKKLRDNNFKYSIKEVVDTKLGIIDEVTKLENFLSLKYGIK